MTSAASISASTTSSPPLPDRPDVTDHPPSGDTEAPDAFFRPQELPLAGTAFDEHSGDVCMPVEANSVELRPEFAHLPLVVDVLREDVFVQVVSGRPMNIQHFPLTVAGRQPGQEPDATLP